MFYDRNGYGSGGDSDAEDKNPPGKADGDDDFWLDDSVAEGDEPSEFGSGSITQYNDRENLSDCVREDPLVRKSVFDENQGYESPVIESVWQFAEVVEGNDPALWRKDEFGDWIYRFDYGKKSAEFGWEIFDPGVGRHNQGVYAMRPMQSQNFLRQYSTI